MKYMIDHASLGPCAWDILAIVALVVLFFYCRKKIKDMLKLRDELQSKLSGEGVDLAFMNEDAEGAPVPLAEEAPQPQG